MAAALSLHVASAQGRSGETAIATIMGNGQGSKLVGQKVTTRGVVTAVQRNGFVIEDPIEDRRPDGRANLITPNALFIYTGERPAIHPGDVAKVRGTVQDYKANPYDHVRTQLSKSPTFEVLAGNQALPVTVLGAQGRPVPHTMRDWLQLSNMHVRIHGGRVVGPSNKYDLAMVADLGKHATGLNAHGVLMASRTDRNAERIVISLRNLTTSQRIAANVGDEVLGADGKSSLDGIIAPDNNGFVSLTPTQEFSIKPKGLKPEVSPYKGDATHMKVITFNVENLGADDPDEKFEKLAHQIVKLMHSGDVIALQEVQDNDGPKDSGTTDASETLTKLTTWIRKLGGPQYHFVDRAPKNNTEGGEPGGNIRVAYLWRPDRVELDQSSVEPIVLDATAKGTRRSLLARFKFRLTGRWITLLNNHLTSKRGSSPELGTKQPPLNGGVTVRSKQTKAARELLEKRLRTKPKEFVMGLGDMNEFPYNKPLQILKGRDFILGSDELAAPDNSYIYGGNGNLIDNMVFPRLMAEKVEFRINHMNAEFADRATDHNAGEALIDMS
ncbi:MAG: hypothetical protein R3C68_00035 [Myxococcota bacterium]